MNKYNKSTDESKNVISKSSSEKKEDDLTKNFGIKKQLSETIDVFISHSKYDIDQTITVYEALTSYGFKCWMDKKDIFGGNIDVDTIGNSLLESKLVVLIYSSKINRSPIVKNELKMAIENEKPIISFRLENADYSPGLKILIGTSQWINAYPKLFDKYIPELIESITHHLNKSEQTINVFPKHNITTSTDGGIKRE